MLGDYPAASRSVLDAALSLCGVLVLLCCSSLAAREISVNDFESLAEATKRVEAGDVIMLEPGLYLARDKVRTRNPGNAGAPIVVRARKPGTAVIQVNTPEAFFVSAPHWHFEGLVIDGRCADHSACEHAFHIVGRADRVQVRQNYLANFNAHIKANGSVHGGALVFPDEVLIEGNLLRNDTPRYTTNPVTPIDVVGGEAWVIRDNLIEDFHKSGGNGVSYGLYLKGNSSDGLIERNLVRCEATHAGGARFGISLGGGGTGRRYCVDQDCSHEHRRGVIRNNVILNCPNEPGIYLNRASDTRISHNTLLATQGIFVRFDTSSATIMGNLVGGKLWKKRGARFVEAGNLIVETRYLDAWLGKGRISPVPRRGTPPVNPRAAFRLVDDDYCGRKRDRRPDIGALERSAKSWCRKFDILDNYRPDRS